MSEPRTYILKVTLRYSQPPIWRRIEVPAGMTLLALHGVLQHAMGWTDSHLHQFRQGKALYGEPDDELGPEFGLNRRDESRVRLADVLRKPKDRMIYEYDFGDSWEHDVVLEKITPAKSESQLPRVVAGQRACPPEDCGGMHG